MDNPPELLAPVQDWNSLKLIVGLIDAIYFGVKAYNMRLKAKNFNRDELKKVAEFFVKNADSDMIFGDSHLINEKCEMIEICDVPKEFDIHRLITSDCFINQPSTFFKSVVIQDVGGLCESLEYSMDYDLWIRIGLKFNVKRINSFLSCFRQHPTAKTALKSNNPLQYHENMKIRKKHGGIKQTYEYYRHVVLDGIKYWMMAK